MGRVKLKQPWSAQRKIAYEPPHDEDEDEGVFQWLFHRHPEVAERETRRISFPHAENGVPEGHYDFIEAFCMGKSCDCRRVMFMVHRRGLNASSAESEHIMTIGYGWEPLSFYLEWMFGDREGAELMRGPIIEPGTLRCGYGHQLLDLFARACLTSREYVDRVQRHYELFKHG